MNAVQMQEINYISRLSSCQNEEKACSVAFPVLTTRVQKDAADVWQDFWCNPVKSELKLG